METVGGFGNIWLARKCGEV